MATIEEQRDACLEAAIHEAGKVVKVRQQRDQVVEMLGRVESVLYLALLHNDHGSLPALLKDVQQLNAAIRP